MTSISRRKLLGGIALTGSAATLAGCGTILYPERKGQRDGQLDPAVVILDGIGLLLFLVPGVIAFAVDFSNGTIYLPGTQSSSLEDEVKTAQFDGTLTEDKLDQAWRDTYGADKPFNVEQLQRHQLDDEAELGQLLKAYNDFA